MTTTMGQLTAQILTDTNRDGVAEDPNTGLPLYPAAIQRAILTAIKYMESKFQWLFRKEGQISIGAGEWFGDLPVDFCNMDVVQYNVGPVIYSRKTGFQGISFEDLVNMYRSDYDTGLPLKYAIRSHTEAGVVGNRFYIYPRIQTNTTTYNLLPNPIATVNGSSVLTVTYDPANQANLYVGQAITIGQATTPIGGISNINITSTISSLNSVTLTYDNVTQAATSTAIGGGTNVQLTTFNPGYSTIFKFWYYYKDAVYPTVDGQVSNSTTSIWFNDATIDLVRMKAMERFYFDTLQSPDIGSQYSAQVSMFEANLEMKNANKQLFNMLST